MAGRCSRVWTLFRLLAAFCGALRAQAVAEYGRMARQSSTATGKAYHTSREIGGVWKTLDKTLQSSPDNIGSREISPGGTARSKNVRSRTLANKPSRASTIVYEDPEKIPTGISYEELVRRFGPSSFEVTDSTGATTVSYQGKERSVDLELQNGKVAKVLTAKLREIAVVAPK
jgi:hypothetical protein